MRGPIEVALRELATVGLSPAVRSFRQPGLREPLGDDDWPVLLGAVGQNRVSGLLTAAIECGEMAATEAQYAQSLAAQRSRMTACLLLEEELIRVTELLESNGIEVRALKGPAVAHLDYPDPAWRVFGDVDLLVRSEQFDSAVDVITSAGPARRFPELRPGFDRRFSKGVEFFAPGQPEIDLHRTFVMGRFGFMIDLDDLWATSESFELAGRTFWALDTEIRFLHACYHVALGGRSTRLAQLRDVVQLSQGPSIDLGRVFELSHRWGGDIVVSLAIQQTWDRLGLVENELSGWAREQHPTSLETRALRSYLDPSVGYAARCLSSLTAIPLRQRAGFVRALAFPTGAYGVGRHSGRLRRWSSAISDLRRIAAPGLIAGRKVRNDDE